MLIIAKTFAKKSSKKFFLSNIYVTLLMLRTLENWLTANAYRHHSVVVAAVQK